MTTESTLVDTALRQWKLNIERADKFFGSLPEEQLLQEVTPGKNRLVYLWGHLIAVHDAMRPLLGFGPKLHPGLESTFVLNPDSSAAETPSAADLRRAWDEVNASLWTGFSGLSETEWAGRHSAVSEEDFGREPHRNRFSILLSRTGHVASHLGQALLSKKPQTAQQ